MKFLILFFFQPALTLVRFGANVTCKRLFVSVVRPCMRAVGKSHWEVHLRSCFTLRAVYMKCHKDGINIVCGDDIRETELNCRKERQTDGHAQFSFGRERQNKT